jgi:hypothetical protein
LLPDPSNRLWIRAVERRNDGLTALEAGQRDGDSELVGFECHGKRPGELGPRGLGCVEEEVAQSLLELFPELLLEYLLEGNGGENAVHVTSADGCVQRGVIDVVLDVPEMSEPVAADTAGSAIGETVECAPGGLRGEPVRGNGETF